MTTKHMSLEPVVPLLVKLGFKKRTGYVFTLDLVPGVLGWLGLNTATRYRAPGEVEINPVIGVRFQEVERLVAECLGARFHAYLPATISSPLGYLMPEKKYKAWVLGPGRPEEVATDMANTIARCGIAFMRSVVDLAELRQRLQGRCGIEHQLVYRRPAAALVAGDVEQARALVDKAIADIAARTDPAAVDLRKFAEALRGRLS